MNRNTVLKRNPAMRDAQRVKAERTIAKAQNKRLKSKVSQVRRWHPDRHARAPAVAEGCAIGRRVRSGHMNPPFRNHGQMRSRAVRFDLI
jgi:hypothetical protein